MSDAFELAQNILRQERNLQRAYNQLEDILEDTRFARDVQNLRLLQSRQLIILNELVDDLEEEQPPPPVEIYFAQHVLQMGETLPVLAMEYNTTVAAIRRVNPGLPENPRPGQLVNLPIRIPQPPEDSFRYMVRRGDTLFQIARRFDTDVDTLVRLNNIADPDVIFPGRILIIPNS